MRLAHEGENAYTVRFVRSALAECAVRAGRAADAVAILLPLLDGPELPTITAQLLYLLAWARLELGELDAAADVAAHAVARARAERAHVVLVDALWVQARTEMCRGHTEGAARILAEAREVALGTRNVPSQLRILDLSAALRQAMGDGPAARALLEQARAVARQLGAEREGERLGQALAALS